MATERFPSMVEMTAVDDTHFYLLFIPSHPSGLRLTARSKMLHMPINILVNRMARLLERSIDKNSYAVMGKGSSSTEVWRGIYSCNCFP
jgi:hypothetical protein